jgi:hypothetical protein
MEPTGDKVFKIKKIKVLKATDQKSSNSDLILPADEISVKNSTRRNSYDGAVKNPID